MAKCTKHMMEDVAATCVDCGDPWCDRCLVPVSRSDGPVRCIECSLVAAGIRPRQLRRTVEPTF